MDDETLADLLAALGTTGDLRHDERLRALAMLGPLAAHLLPPSTLTIFRTLGSLHRDIVALREENQRLRGELATFEQRLARLEQRTPDGYAGTGGQSDAADS